MTVPRLSEIRRLVILLTAVLLLAGGSLGLAQSTTPDHLNKDFLVGFARDFVSVFATPFHWDREDVQRFALVSLATIFTVTIDQRTRDWVQTHRTDASDDISANLRQMGNAFYLLGFSGALYAAGEIWRSPGLRRTALLSLESMLIAGALVSATKIIIGRGRPYSSMYPLSFRLFSTRAAYNSFPSGHTAAAFAVATTIARQTRSVAVDILAYSAATLVGLSRIHDDEHWVSSVVAGAAAGYFIAAKIDGLHRRAHPARAVNLGFQWGPDRKALTLTYVF
jgi:membrane-associated phospholipid phosphatase